MIRDLNDNDMSISPQAGRRVSNHGAVALKILPAALAEQLAQRLGQGKEGCTSPSLGARVPRRLAHRGLGGGGHVGPGTLFEELG